MRPLPPGAEPDPADSDAEAETIDVGLTQTPAYLARFLPFQSLNEEILRLLHTNMSERAFAKGDLLIKQGEPGTSLMVVAEGEIEVSVEEDGKHYLLKRAGVGEVLGEMALLTKEPRTASVTAMTPVRALVISADRFDHLARGHPKLSSLLTLLLASRLGRLQHDAMTGNIFHGYRIRRCLGTGGMSVVYEAEEAESHRLVALKMMSHRLLYDPVAMKRFKREFEIVESLDHQNIAKTYGRFEAFRTSFIVMELCEGVSIDDAMESRGRLPELMARKVLGQVARAVDHAHQAGIVHRDIKPSNIMASRDGVVKLIDFGLAGFDDEILTKALFGTPRYMAPEQMTGGPLGKKTDLFALGLVAYEMVTGEHLFKSKGFQNLREEVIACRVPDLSERFPEISAEYCGVLAGLLLRNPDERRLDVDLVGSWAGPVEFEPGPGH